MITAASTLALATFGLGLPASASTAPKAGLKACVSATTYDVTGRTAGWGPTSLSSSWAVGPQTISIAQTATADQSYSYSGSVAISVSALGASATASYGQTYTSTIGNSTTWTYSAAVPSGKTGRLLSLHRMDKISFTKIIEYSNCTTSTTTGLVAYLPWNDKSNTAYCWIMDISPAKTSWRSTCSD